MQSEVAVLLVPKSKIGVIIKKERRKEYDRCKQDNDKLLKRTVSELKTKHRNELKDLERDYEQKLKDLERDYEQKLKDKLLEIMKLREEITKNYTLYQELRQREIELDHLSVSFEAVLNEMSVKVQESIQPFLRARGKIESVKRASDRKDAKVEAVFSGI